MLLMDCQVITYGLRLRKDCMRVGPVFMDGVQFAEFLSVWSFQLICLC